MHEAFNNVYLKETKKRKHIFKQKQTDQNYDIHFEERIILDL